MAKRILIPAWTIFWLSEIIEELNNYKPEHKYKRYFKIKCLNCWWEWIKELKDLKKERSPRTCWKCNYWGWKTRNIKTWTNINWYIFIRNVKKDTSENPRIIVYDLNWNEKEVSRWRFLRWELDRWLPPPAITHWMAWTRFYKIYRWMLDRCNTPSASHYNKYWWRWIQCLWNTFEEFKNDMYEDYINHLKLYWVKNTTIDRIDVNWNYCKDNCRWATVRTQLNNKNNNIEIPDKYWDIPLIDLLEIHWVTRPAFYYRLSTGKTFDQALWIN